MSCSCNSMAAKMDRNGPEWVRENVDLLTEESANNARQLGYNVGTLEKIGITLLILAHCRISEGKRPTILQRVAMNRAEKYFRSCAVKRPTQSP